MCRIGILDHLGMSTMLVPPERGLDPSLVRSKPLLWHICWLHKKGIILKRLMFAKRIPQPTIYLCFNCNILPDNDKNILYILRFLLGSGSFWKMCFVLPEFKCGAIYLHRPLQCHLYTYCATANYIFLIYIIFYFVVAQLVHKRLHNGLCENAPLWQKYYLF